MKSLTYIFGSFLILTILANSQKHEEMPIPETNLNKCMEIDEKLDKTFIDISRREVKKNHDISHKLEKARFENSFLKNKVLSLVRENKVLKQNIDTTIQKKGFLKKIIDGLNHK